MPRLVPGGRNVFLLQIPGHHKALAGRVSFISRWSSVRRGSWHLSARRIALRVFLLKWLESFEKLKDTSSSQVNSSMLWNATFRRWLFQLCKLFVLLPLVSLLNSVNKCPLNQLHHMLWEPLKILGLPLPSSANLCAGFFGVSMMPVLSMASLATCPSKVFLSSRIAHRLLEILGSGIPRIAADAGWPQWGKV